MRRVISRLLVTVVTVTSFGVGFAGEKASSQNLADETQTGKQGVSSVTDAQGNPIDLRSSAVPEATSRKTTGGTFGPVMQRGQAWWPYATALVPYSNVNRAVESLTEDEILINGVATINVKNAQGTLSRMPKDLVLQSGDQLRDVAGYYLVKLRGVSRTQADVDALQNAGAVLGEYMNVNTYVARIPGSALSAVQSLPIVSWVGDYEPAYKISPRIGLEWVPQREAIDAATGHEQPWLFEITLHRGAPSNEVLDRLAGLSIFPGREDVVETPEMTVVYARSAPEFIPMIAQIPGVKFIAEHVYPQLMASSTNPTVNPMILQNNGVWTTNTSLGWKLWNAGIDGNASGTAQIVTLMDTGLNTNNEHFSQDTVAVGTIGASHRKVVAYDNFGGDLCVNNFALNDGGHGTETSQHAVGSISNMTSNPDTTHTPNTFFDDGIAKDGKVYFQDIGIPSGNLTPPADLGPSVAAAVSHGSFIQNHSWGANSPTYTSTANSLDAGLFNNPGVVATVSSGNNGATGTSTITDLCTGKNVICVGGSDPGSPNQLFENCSWDGNAGDCTTNDLGSGRGPIVGSSRTKPDILTYMANWNSVGGEFEAVDLSHAMCQSDAVKTPYWDFVNNSQVGGTSFAAPEAAGLAALIRDYFQAGFYPSGTATPANALTPTGSLVKAVLLSSGEDMATTGWPTTSIAVLKRYSNDVGYGRSNLPGVLHIGSSAPFLWVQNGDSLGDGATKTTFYNINSNSVPLRVMMVWYDAAGNALQKDADLKVTIGANVYLGNNLSSGWSATGGSADHTNTTEGVFLDAAHGLPATGTVRVDVVGFNDPGGMTYSLVVTGDVASQAVTQVSLDKGKYNCSDTIRVTVNDVGATSPVNVTLTSKNSSSTTIDTQIVPCTGSGGVFTGSIVANSGINVVDGGTVTATYSTATPATSNIVCQVAVADGGFILSGGCDNTTAGTDNVNGPLTNGGVNEFYNRYMDAGENTSYTFGFVNQTGATLHDVNVSLSFSGAAAGHMTVLNNPVRVGTIPVDGLTGAVFQVQTDGSATGLSSVNMDFDVTSPGDGYTANKRITQVQLLQANDVIVREKQCSTFQTLASFNTWFESPITGRATNTWKWSGSATNPTTVSSETRMDGLCANNTINSAAMVGNSATTSNFTANADSFLLQRFQPVLQGNGPSGQPYHYVWKWHSFYHASETLNATTGVWGAFYNDKWNQAVNPTGDQATNFPIALAYFYQTIFDYVGTWNWETANTGTPDNPNLNANTVPTSPPNQLFITFNGVTGLATSSTWFSYGHEHADLFWFTGTPTLALRRDIALDNDNLVYDEYYTAAQAGNSCGAGGQVGLVAFDRFSYSDCPHAQAKISVTDNNAVGPTLQVVLTSPGTGDSENLTLSGSPPFFSGTITLSTDSGVAFNDGTLLVLPNETINVSYTDGSPAGTSTATANVACSGGDVVYVSNVQVSDNGDNDGIPDNNETVTLDITIQNNTANPLTNTKVTIFSTSSTIDCVGQNTANYGTVASGAQATNPPGSRFKFHVASSTACVDWQNPPAGTIKLLITADGLNGAQVQQSFTTTFDLDNQIGGPYTYTQNFNTNPGWVTAVTPDDSGTCTGYTNSFHWCAACGNASGGYGAWTGNSAFGTAGQEYPDMDSSTLYSPVFTANGGTTLTFSVAYRTENTFDGAIVEYSINGGAWTLQGFTTPPQATTTSQDDCSPLNVSETAWTGNGVSWTTTNAAAIPTANGQTIQFRWRLGTDSATGGPSYGGYGVDNVSIANLLQTQVCEPTRNTGLPGCSFCASAPDGTPCDDSNACTSNDQCSSGTCAGTPIGAPGDVGPTVSVNKSGTDANLGWTAASNSTTSDVLRGLLSALPVGPGGGDETCFSGIVGTSVTDSSVPAAGTGYWYLVRGHNTCAGAGTYGTQGVNGNPGAPRVSTTCP